MKISDSIAQFLEECGVTHVFGISGGASLHLIHSIYALQGMKFHCLQHEQACGFAADAYARLTGLGCCLATSGPGATNLITPLAACFYDSVPCLFIAGQVTVARMATGWGVRQYGFQWTPIVEMVKLVTKYAIEPMRAEDVMPAMREAVRIAKEGRPGPVLISIPDDIQRAEI